MPGVVSDIFTHTQLITRWNRLDQWPQGLQLFAEVGLCRLQASVVTYGACYQLLREVCEVECGSKAALRPSKPTHAAERCHMQCGGKRLRKVPGSLERSRSACESGSCQSSRSRCDRVQCIDHLMRCIVRMAASADTPARYGAHASATERDYVWCRHYCGWECCGMGTRHHGITNISI